MEIIDARYRPLTPPVFAAFNGAIDPMLKKVGFPGLVKSETLKEALMPALDAGVEKIVFTGRDTGGGSPYDNDYVARTVQEMPERIVGVGGVNAMDVSGAIAKIRHIAQLGLRGISMDVAPLNMAANDHRLYPLYELCLELALPVFLTVGPMPVPGCALEYANPLWIDRLAQDFPRLTIIASHGIFPFTQEWIVVAWRNDNVYLDTSCYMDQPGVATLLGEAANRSIGDKIIFASGYPGCPVKYAIDAIKNMGIRDEILPLIFSQNIKRALKLES